VPHLTPALPLRYRRRALAALEGLVTRARGDVARHLATVGRLAAAGERTTDARASLGFAENNLALLRGRQRFLRPGELPPEECPRPAAWRGGTARRATDPYPVTVRVASARERPDDLEVRHRS